jgi:hypothetical protein
LDDYDAVSDAAVLVLVLAVSVFAIIVVPVVADVQWCSSYSKVVVVALSVFERWR